MDSWSDYYQRQIDNHQTTVLEEQCLYDHLLECVKIESPEELIARFRSLFIHGVGYSDPQVWRALKQIVNAAFAEKDFKFVLNRSCHILINHWLMQPRLHSAIPQLVALFDDLPGEPGRSITTSSTTVRLRERVQAFKSTQQYVALKRVAQVVNHTPDWAATTGFMPLGTLLRRYPCLYDHSLLTEDSTSEQRRRVRHIRRQMQRQFEQELSRYATYKRIGDSSGVGSGINSAKEAFIDPGERSLRNPTLLSDRRLDRALQHFSGKIDGSNTYRDLAQRFLTYTGQAHTYRLFKDDLYEYLTASIDTKYGKSQFNQRLYTYVQEILPDYNTQCLSDVLLVGTCRKLLNFLIVESCQNLNHVNFVDLTGNLGATATIGLLLKIVLICRNVKPYLEKQFSILFNHYETCAREGVVWLIESLESLNVAFSINFGTLSL